MLGSTSKKTSQFRIAVQIGARIASASSEGTVKHWDARPLTPELRIEQQAVNLLNLWLAKPLSKE